VSNFAVSFDLRFQFSRLVRIPDKFCEQFLVAAGEPPSLRSFAWLARQRVIRARLFFIEHERRVGRLSEFSCESLSESVNERARLVSLVQKQASRSGLCVYWHCSAWHSPELS